MLGIELDAEAPEHVREGDERTQRLDRRRIGHRDVHGVLDKRAVAKRHELTRDVDGDIDLRLGGVRAQMRRDHHARMRDEAPERLRARRLFTPHVDGSAGHVAAL